MGVQGSNDKPKFNLGVQGLDDLSAGKIIKTVASLVPRNYVVMEVKDNLVAADRQANLKKFSSRHFKKIAHVVMGEPDAAHKELVKNKLLKVKQAKLDAQFKQQQAEKAKKKLIAQKAKEAAERKRKADEARKAALDAKKKKEEEANKKTSGEGDDVKEEKKEEEDVKEETMEEEEKVEEEEADADPPIAELIEEESKAWFSKNATTDLSNDVLEKSFGNFGIPTLSEGFDDIK